LFLEEVLHVPPNSGRDEGKFAAFDVTHVTLSSVN
jgi:hypothetical protein